MNVVPGPAIDHQGVIQALDLEVVPETGTIPGPARNGPREVAQEAGLGTGKLRQILACSHKGRQSPALK